MHNGSPVEFELNSSDVSTAAPLVLRNAGDNASRGLASDERLIILSLSATVVTTSGFIFRDADAGHTLDAGDLMIPLGTGINNPNISGNGMAGAVGVIPYVKMAAGGQVYIAGSGVVVKG